jgi:hypothetical protein
MSFKRRKGALRAKLADVWRESSEWLAAAARIIIEIAIVYLLFLVGDLLLLGAIELAFGSETPFILNLLEGVKVFSIIAIVVGYVLHVMSSLRYQVPPSKLQDQADLIPPHTSLRQIEEAYSDKIQLVDEVIKQLRQQSIRSIKK